MLFVIALTLLASPGYAQEPTIPYTVWEWKDADSKTVFATTNPGYRPMVMTSENTSMLGNFIDWPENQIKEILKGLTTDALKFAVDAAKATACPAVGDGDVSVSFTVDAGGELKLNLGIGAGITIGFRCKDGEPV